MKPVLKVAMVAAGFLAAFIAACAAVALHAALTGESGAQAYGGMSAFGDRMLFVGVFGAFSLVPSGAGLFFLLSKRKMHDQAPVLTPSSGAPPAGMERRVRWCGWPRR